MESEKNLSVIRETQIENSQLSESLHEQAASKAKQFTDKLFVSAAQKVESKKRESLIMSNLLTVIDRKEEIANKFFNDSFDKKVADVVLEQQLNVKKEDISSKFFNDSFDKKANEVSLEKQLNAPLEVYELRKEVEQESRLVDHEDCLNEANELRLKLESNAEENEELKKKIQSLELENTNLCEKISNTKVSLTDLKNKFEQEISKRLEIKDITIAEQARRIMDLERQIEDDNTRDKLVEF